MVWTTKPSTSIRLALAVLPALLGLAACGQITVALEDVGADVPTALDAADAPGTPDAGAPPVDVAQDLAPVDKAPTVQITSPAKGTLLELAKSVHISATASDDHDLPGALTAVWRSTALAAPLHAGPCDAAGVTAFDLATLPAGPQTLSVEVTDSKGQLASAALAVLVDTAPGAPVVEILPPNPTALDALSVHVLADAADPDRLASQLVYAYAWLRDGLATTETGKTVAAGVAKKGETWQVQVWASDPVTAGPKGTAQVVLGNAPPTAPTVAIVPAAVDLLSEVTCTLVTPGTDPDGDPITYSYAWKLGGAVVPLATTAKIQVNQLDDLLAAAGVSVPLKKGDLLQCTATASDGSSASAVAASPEVVLQAFDVCGSVVNPCDLAASCSNTDTLAVLCTCPPGFVGDGESCLDIDECKTGGCSPAATCVNTVGSAICACKPGFVGDGKVCKDIDECQLGSAACDLAADCSNTAGSYVCVCQPGYSGDGKSCQDIDECADNSAGCSAAAVCSNTPGNFACICKAGLQGNGKVCVDIDECATNNGGCSANATCVNSYGSYACECLPGFDGSGLTCTDINECAFATSPCATEASCSNLPGGYSCACKPGFQGDGLSCQDIDECAVGNGGCDPVGGACWNEPGSFSCTCAVGFVGDGYSCYDVNECTLGTAGCSTLATCTNLVGSFACACLPGFSGDGFYCSLTDLCSVANGGCPPDAKCAMAADKTVCSCKPGFLDVNGDGLTCVDIDECASGNGGCSKFADCSNLPGSFTCACKTGYAGNGYICSDINECAVQNGGCSKFATCLNTSPGYACTCKPGFAGDGALCTDIDECATGTATCSSNATCSNLLGSFACACNPGWAGDGKTCTDINECAVNNGGCSANADCVNLDGSFQCTCSPGYWGDGKLCLDIDECGNGTQACDPAATCSNTDGGYVCTCPAGYQGSGFACTDINECPIESYTWDFANGNGGWTYDATYAYVPGTGTKYPFSPPVKWQLWKGALFYGNTSLTPTNYVTLNYANRGSATGPAVVLSNHAAHRLSFDLDFGATPTSEISNLAQDKLSVQLVIGFQVVTVWDKSAVLGPGMHRYSVLLEGYGGKSVQLRFAFDTINQVNNAGPGLTIDHLDIRADGGPCGTGGCTNSAGSYACQCIAPLQSGGKSCGLPGAPDFPAVSCLDVLSSAGLSSPGLYWIATTAALGGKIEMLCDGEGWTRIDFAQFTPGGSGSAGIGAWNAATTQGCGGYGSVGIPTTAGGSVGGFVSSLPPHTQIRITGKYLRIDAWDGDTAWLAVDGAKVWSQPFFGVPGPSQCGNPSWFETSTGLDVIASHSATQAVLTLGADLDLPGSEAFAVDDLAVWVR